MPLLSTITYTYGFASGLAWNHDEPLHDAHHDAIPSAKVKVRAELLLNARKDMDTAAMLMHAAAQARRNGRSGVITHDNIVAAESFLTHAETLIAEALTFPSS